MRRRHVIEATLALLALGLATGCSSSTASSASSSNDPSFPAAPLATVTSRDGKLTLAAYTAPGQPPPRGMISAKVVVTDATSGKPVEGLTFAIEPLMPAMGHGTPVVPRTTPKGGGAYLVEDLKLFMAGRWDLHMDITGAVTDAALVSVDVQ